MDKYFIVGLGGFIGSVLRFGVGQFFLQSVKISWFPWSTLFVNSTGSVVMGLLSIWGLSSSSPMLARFFCLGLLGSYTTFSTFSLETVTLYRDVSLGMASINIGLNLLCSLGPMVFIIFYLKPS